MDTVAGNWSNGFPGRHDARGSFNDPGLPAAPLLPGLLSRQPPPGPQATSLMPGEPPGHTHTHTRGHIGAPTADMHMPHTHGAPAAHTGAHTVPVGGV